MNQPQLAVPSIRKNDNWARSNKEKAEVFATHLAEVFTLNPSKNSREKEEEIQKILDKIHQSEISIKEYSMSEVRKTIMKSFNPHTAPGYDLITGLLRKFSEKGLMYLTKLFNSIQRFYPPQWKVAE